MLANTELVSVGKIRDYANAKKDDFSFRFHLFVVVAIATREENDVWPVVQLVKNRESANYKGQVAEGLVALVKTLAKSRESEEITLARAVIVAIQRVSAYWRAVALVEIFGISKAVGDRQLAEDAISEVKSEDRQKELRKNLKALHGNQPNYQNRFNRHLIELAAILAAISAFKAGRRMVPLETNSRSGGSQYPTSWSLEMRVQTIASEIITEAMK